MRAGRRLWEELKLDWQVGLHRLPFFTQRAAVALLGVLVATLALLGGLAVVVRPQLPQQPPALTGPGQDGDSAAAPTTLPGSGASGPGRAGQGAAGPGAAGGAAPGVAGVPTAAQPGGGATPPGGTGTGPGGAAAPTTTGPAAPVTTAPGSTQSTLLPPVTVSLPGVTVTLPHLP